MKDRSKQVSVESLADCLTTLEIQRDRYVLLFVQQCDGLLDDEMVFHSLGETEGLIKYSNRLIAMIQGMISTYTARDDET